ncbi:Fe/S biogenesis protein NfuA [Luteitalea sp. TBR-22]|uniref:NifU family protein n=1 Tax=Luteitalea sp. TBR-22 TaxID=2802971 RepID=UPI001AFA7B8E|nr:NifU family protein [Luteitalea sp. TBR-22]BCS32053.1 Fe/S biogenesis protein NfuA [Luteitalea sp. TBR-22]
MITITDIALEKIAESRKRLQAPVKGLRVLAVPRSPLRADFGLRFVPAEEPASPTDIVQRVEGIDVYITQESAPYLEDATIDFVFRIVGSDFEVVTGLRRLDTPEGAIAERIQEAIEQEVNPSLATHGGESRLIDFRDGVVFLELSGGCQGCSMAGATLKDGIETSLKRRVPEVREVRDVTRHANGRTPYYQ